MELLERGQFLQSLADCPPGRVVLVSGEAGIGKTSLLKAWRAASDRRVLWGSCDALRTPRPLGPLHDMARQAGGQLAASMAAGHSRQAMFGAFLDELTARPAVAIVDDAHWADEATLDLLVYAVRRISLTASLLRRRRHCTRYGRALPAAARRGRPRLGRPRLPQRGRGRAGGVPGSGAARRGAAPVRAARRASGRPHGAAGRCARPASRGARQQGDRRAPQPVTQDGGPSRLGILAKLGVRTRQEAASRAENGEPATPR